MSDGARDTKIGAGEGIRTLDFNLGKVTGYQSAKVMLVFLICICFFRK